MIISVPIAHREVLIGLNLVGHEAYIVGGAVRDLLLNQQPKDFDITTSATPEQVTKLFPDSELVGAHFGVVLVKMMGYTIEVATFRTDGVYSDGRRPDAVKFTTDVQEDLKRRDFTMNALLLDADGRLIDLVGGQDDIKRKVIRAIGDPHMRFREDPVRILRAVRFLVKLKFGIDYLTSAAMLELGRQLERVAPERVAKELTGILTSGNAALGVQVLGIHGLFDYTIPALKKLNATPQNPKHHPEGDVMTHTLGLLRQLQPGCSPTLAWAALLHDIGKPATFGLSPDFQPTFYGHEEVGATIAGNILRRLKFSNEFIDVVVGHVADHMRFRVIEEMRKSKQLRFVRQNHFAELLSLHYMDAMAGSGKLDNFHRALDLLLATPPEKVRPVKLVTGDDLIASGLKPGPQFKALLEKIEDAQLEGTVTTRVEALAMITDWIGEAE